MPRAFDWSRVYYGARCVRGHDGLRCVSNKRCWWCRYHPEQGLAPLPPRPQWHYYADSPRQSPDRKAITAAVGLLVPRKVAQELGLRFYRTAGRCINGHLNPPRYTSSKGCVLCDTRTDMPKRSRAWCPVTPASHCAAPLEPL